VVIRLRVYVLPVHVKKSAKDGDYTSTPVLLPGTIGEQSTSFLLMQITPTLWRTVVAAGGCTTRTLQAR
jgi:hypothetical protein